MADNRTRNWSFILYPDSAPEDWKVKLKALLVPVAISPLHTKPEEGTEEELKPHHHIFIKFDGVKTYTQAKEITELFNGTIPKPVRSPIGLIRYFIHKDDPKKEQFEFADIIVYNGFDISMYDSYTDKELNILLADIMGRIRKEHITEFCSLIDDVMDSGEWDYYSIIRKNSQFINSYITSYRHKRREELIEMKKKGIL